MREGLLTWISLAGLAAAYVMQGAVAAAPIALAEAPTMVAPSSRLFEEIYYYGGRYYPYRYNGRYYAHRAYRHGHWRYY